VPLISWIGFTDSLLTFALTGADDLRTSLAGTRGREATIIRALEGWGADETGTEDGATVDVFCLRFLGIGVIFYSFFLFIFKFFLLGIVRYISVAIEQDSALEVYFCLGHWLREDGKVCIIRLYSGAEFPVVHLHHLLRAGSQKRQVFFCAEIGWLLAHLLLFFLMIFFFFSGGDGFSIYKPI
jgi:hypothetical protein